MTLHAYTVDGTHRFYPYRMYIGYSLREAKRLYRNEFGLRYKRNIVFCVY
jgi:hypothetical protein